MGIKQLFQAHPALELNLPFRLISALENAAVFSGAEAIMLCLRQKLKFTLLRTVLSLSLVTKPVVNVFSASRARRFACAPARPLSALSKASGQPGCRWGFDSW
jgi:hypothetical protein